MSARTIQNMVLSESSCLSEVYRWRPLVARCCKQASLYGRVSAPTRLLDTQRSQGHLHPAIQVRELLQFTIQTDREGLRRSLIIPSLGSRTVKRN